MRDAQTAQFAAAVPDPNIVHAVEQGLQCPPGGTLIVLARGADSAACRAAGQAV